MSPMFGTSVRHFILSSRNTVRALLKSHRYRLGHHWHRHCIRNNPV